MSGASALAIKDLSSPSYDVGRPSSTVYDDLDGVGDIRTLIRDHPAREIDNYLLDVSKTTPNIRTAIVFPPIIYGKGEGPGNQRSVQIPALCRVTLERGHVVRAGEGLNRWGSIHVKDVARVFTGLAEQALKNRQDEALWNDNGIYLTTSGDFVSLQAASSPCALCFKS
jgi:nucleoside-diphosphate-sugar epimerase